MCVFAYERIVSVHQSALVCIYMIVCAYIVCIWVHVCVLEILLV